MKNKIISLLLVVPALIFEIVRNYDFAKPESSNENYNVRTVKYQQEDTIDDGVFEEFNSNSITDTGNGFRAIAIKEFPASLFKTIDYVSKDIDGVVDVVYEINYFESEGRATLDVYQLKGKCDIELLETIEGLIIENDRGRPDVFFADEDSTILLSKLLEESTLSEAGWWSNFCNWIKGAANKIIDVVVTGLRLLNRFAVSIIGLDGAAKILCMTKDSNGIYHADFDCWQAIGGYNNFYDFVFNLGTNMKSFQYDFYDSNNNGYTDYTLRGRKGDYRELGYGGELGIYKRLGKSNQRYVDKNLAIDMTLKVDFRKTISSSWTTLFNWDPSKAEGYSNKSWWITGFDPNANSGKVLSNANLLRATYTVKFVTKGYSASVDNSLKNNFYSEYCVKNKYRDFNSSTQIFTYKF